MVVLPAGPGRTVRLLFSRGPGSDFSERDRTLLTLLRPHLHAALVATERRRLGIAPLTPRQREILQYVAVGMGNHQIARRLNLSEATVRKHLENIFARLDVTSRTAAVARAGMTA
jgi:DNA-binding NarL/FixJ family response regulator